jgi:hypothetical protein
MQDEILICRQHTAWFLLEHEDNVLRGTFTKGHSKRRLEDKDRGENKKQKVHQKEKNQEVGVYFMEACLPALNLSFYHFTCL